MSSPAAKACDRKCVSKLIAKARRKWKNIDPYIEGGAVNMINFRTGKGYTGWPGLSFRYPAPKKDGSPSRRLIRGYFSLKYCPVCGGAI